MQVPIYQGQEQRGTLTMARQGLYAQFNGTLRADGLCRIYGVFEGGEISLGVPVPEGQRLCLRASMPASRLPGGMLKCGRIVYEAGRWQRFQGGSLGGVHYPPGLRQGNRLRFPWKQGQRLPAEEVFVFYRLVEEQGSCYLELALDEDGKPVLPE